MEPQEELLAEVNLIRWPWSLLATKDLRRAKPILCTAEIKDENGHTVQAEWRAEQLASRHYPGPLAHHAFLVLVQMAVERGVPVANPIRFSWYELCKRMGIQPFAENIRGLKRAIIDTKSLTLFSANAIKDKASGKLLSTTEKAWSIYANVAFCERQVDGTVVGVNEVTLDPWIVRSLNESYLRRLDYTLWKALHDESAVASRLYELLSIKFSEDRDRWPIGYNKLASYLPIKPQRFVSKAKEKLEPALQILKERSVIVDCEWVLSNRREEMKGVTLLFTRGSALVAETTADENQPQQAPSAQPPERELVQLFYRLHYRGEPYYPLRSDYRSAKTIISRYGRDRAMTLLRPAIERMERSYRRRRVGSFGAVVKFIHELVQWEEGERRRHQEADRQLAATRRLEEQHRQEDAAIRLEWDEAGPEIRQMVLDEIRPGPWVQRRASVLLHEQGPGIYAVRLLLRRWEQEDEFHRLLAELAAKGTPDHELGTEGEFTVLEARPASRGIRSASLYRL